MILQATNPAAPAPSRLLVGGEWLLVIGLAVTLAWTTLCLGGYLAETMVVTSWAVFVLAALGGILWAVGRGGEPVRCNLAVLLPVPFLIYALASVLWLAPAKWLAWREWLLWFQMWLVFALVLHFGHGRKQTWVLVGTLAALGVAGVVMAAYQRYVDHAWLMLGRKQAEQFVGRSGGMFGIPNSLAGLLELMVPVCLTMLFSRATKPSAKIVVGWLAALFTFAVVLTGSRGGWIGLGLALLIWPLLTGRDWRKRLTGAVVILALAVGGVTALHRYSDYARERIQPFIEGRFEPSRPIIWKAAVRIWRDHRWLGGGAASYNVLFDQYRPKGFFNEPDWAHNDYLNTLSDYGVAGFVLWFGAGAGLGWFGWKSVRRARTEGGGAAQLFDSGKWKLGLWLGLGAFALHLAVDFHTKLPALAFAAAVVAALLVRDEPWLRRPLGGGGAKGVGVVLVVVSVYLVVVRAAPLYCAEAARYDRRRAIDKNARSGEGDIVQIVPAALAAFERAVKIDPTNGQAWADLAYARTLNWHQTKGDLVSVGRDAQAAAERAVALCPANAEFWVRKGVALDMQARQKEGEACFKRAVQLAPNSGVWWYHLAYHLSVFPERKHDALSAVDTCLSLDPSNAAGIALRQQLVTPR